MYKIFILDTNIYRQLGAEFYNHVDYENLINYGFSAGAEILVVPAVVSEYLDFYKREILEKNTQAIQKGYEKLNRLDRFNKVKAPDFSRRIKGQLNFVREKLLEGNLKLSANSNLQESDLIDFLIINKQEDRKDNTRDYLIWQNVLFAAQHWPDNLIVLISDDRIFTENTYFQEFRSKKKLENISVYKNIPAFLSIYGFNSPMLTAELILKSIPVEVIEQELLEHKNSIPSYISRFYYYTERDFKLEEFRIDGIRVDTFYAHRDIEENKVGIIAQIKVKVYMLFEPEQDTDELIRYFQVNSNNPYLSTEIFDPMHRPIYHHEVLFLFSLDFSEESNRITRVEFLSFFPEDHYLDSYRGKYKS